MSPREFTFSSWAELKALFLQTTDKAMRTERPLLVFRGQGDGAWPLSTTLDRAASCPTRADREKLRSGLITEFRRLSAGLISDLVVPLDERDWELLARHHGLPMPILDWTTSPYIASFFAFDEEPQSNAEYAAVWMLNRQVLLDDDIPAIEFIDENRAIRFNARAIEQRSVFLRVDTIEQPLEDLLAGGLYKLRVPRSERALALADLDASLVNARTLFRDLDGAARAAKNRALAGGECP